MFTVPRHFQSRQTVLRRMTKTSPFGLIAFVMAAFLFSACDKKGEVAPQSDDKSNRTTQSAQKEKKAAAKKLKVTQALAKKKPVTEGHSTPLGPRLIFVAGKGVGAIRFGATFKTIERHMGAPCDVRTEVRCLYVRQAIDFTMKDGVLVRLKGHRRGRKVTDIPGGHEQFYGFARAMIRPSIEMGLHRHIVIEEFGEPLSKEPIEGGADGLVDRQRYDGVIFEYDKIENGNVILAGIEIYPSKTAEGAPNLHRAAAKKVLPSKKPTKSTQPHKNADLVR